MICIKATWYKIVLSTLVVNTLFNIGSIAGKELCLIHFLKNLPTCVHVFRNITEVSVSLKGKKEKNWQIFPPTLFTMSATTGSPIFFPLFSSFRYAGLDKFRTFLRKTEQCTKGKKGLLFCLRKTLTISELISAE